MAENIHPLIKLKEKYPQEAFVSVTGYIGTAEGKTVRIYSNLAAKKYCEIPADAVIHREEADCGCGGAKDTEVPKVRLYMKSSASVKITLQDTAKDLFTISQPVSNVDWNGDIRPGGIEGSVAARIALCRRQYCEEARTLGAPKALLRFHGCLHALGLSVNQVLNELLNIQHFCNPGGGVFIPPDTGNPVGDDRTCGGEGQPPCDYWP